MPLQLDRLAELDAALAEGTLLLVPNYRSSDQLVDQLCRHQQRVRGGVVFARPAVRAIDLWLTELWNELAQLHTADILQWRVLQPAEEQLLWQQLIRKVSPELLLLNRDGSAAAAASAWRLLQQWQIPLGELRVHLELSGDPVQKDDREYAWAWLHAFDDTCRRQRLLSFSSMLQQLLHFVEDGSLTQLQLLPRRLLRAGFDAPPPLYQALFTAMRAQGVAIADWNFTAFTPRQLQQSAAVPASECRAAADWAQALLREDPAASIGIITDDTQILQGELERSFAHVFGQTPHLFSTTLSATLADAAYVHTALACIALLEPELDTLQCCALLRSPWLVAAEREQDARAELELRLRKNQALQIRSADLRELCMQDGKAWHCPVLGAGLTAMHTRLLRQPRQQPLHAWLQFFIGCWDTLLPRDTLLQSGDRALVKAWEGLLRQAQQSSALFGNLDFDGASALLARLARVSTLTTSNTQAPVQLLTPVTAAGLHFTHLWCMQMTESLWPGEQQPHPYLPLNLQRQHALPGVDRDAHLQQRSDLLQGLVQRTTHEVVFSHATSNDDLPQRRTELLPGNLERRTSVESALPGALSPALEQIVGPALELLQDSIVIAPDNARAVQGGAGILTSQSACPFRSFAQYRLQARQLPQPLYGIPPNALGDCIHDALRVFWDRMQSHAALVASDVPGLKAAIDLALVPALNTLARRYPSALTPRLQALETQRLSTLLLRWLDIERTRGPFTVVATEQELLWSLPHLQLHLRIDRIDRHADGSTAVIDYKSGKRRTTRWDDARPAEPQLLLYQLALDAEHRLGDTAALLYARVNVEESAYDGIARDDSIAPGLAFEQQSLALPDWPTLKHHWEQVVTLLADEFLQGYAAVQPMRRDSCTYCHLTSLCRIAELDAAQPAPEDLT
ncbi:MAG: hypothetical protein RLZZ227_2022 [Pseudomonadota bacterium]